MAVIAAQVTEDARIYWPQMFGGLATFELITEFKVGEGGWVDPGTGKVARTPVDSLRRVDNSVQDIDAVVDATRAALDQRYPSTSQISFTKVLASSDFSFVSPTKLEVRCLLDATDFIDDGFGNPPELWEIGIFSDHPVLGGQKLMVAYGTFSMQIKGSTPLLNIVRIVF